MPTVERPIIGRERALIDGLARAIHSTLIGPTVPSRRTRAAVVRHRYSRPSPTARGVAFEVQVGDPDGNPTGHVARVTVELDRFVEEMAGLQVVEVGHRRSATHHTSTVPTSPARNHAVSVTVGTVGTGDDANSRQ